MNIVFKYLDRSCLDEDGLKRIIKKYGSALKYDVVVVFDLRIRDFGTYEFSSTKRKHIIRISPIKCCYNDDGSRKNKSVEKYEVISALIHELRHAQQKEELGHEFWSKKYSLRSDIISKFASDFYSPCEVDARLYENRNILQAVELYNSLCYSK